MMRTVKTARNPVWTNGAQTAIDLFVIFVELADTIGEVPFTATSTSVEDYAQALYTNAVAGEYGAVGPYVTSVATVAQLDATARGCRDRRIADLQWLTDRHRDQSAAGAATTLTIAQFQALLAYRQALRDWPSVVGFPADTSQPVVPDWLIAAEASTAVQ